MAIKKSPESSLAAQKRAAETFENIDDRTPYKKHFQAQQRVSIATRIQPAYKEALEQYAIQQNRRLSSVLHEWIVEKMQAEHLIPRRQDETGHEQ